MRPIPTLSEQTWAGYQTQAAKTALYPHDVGLAYVALGAAGEVGELRAALKAWYPRFFREKVSGAWRVWRGLPERLSIERRKCIYECGDVSWYFAMACNELKIQPEHLRSDSIVWYHSPMDALTILTEMFCQDVKRVYRDTDRAEIPAAMLETMRGRLSSGIWVLNVIATTMGVWYEDVLKMNLEKLERRQREDKIKGAGDER